MTLEQLQGKVYLPIPEWATKVGANIFGDIILCDESGERSVAVYVFKDGSVVYH